MNPQAKKAYLRPKDVKPAEARKVLNFLNAAKTAKEIVGAIEYTGEMDVGVKVGIKVVQNILNRRAQLGGFEDLKQVASVPQVGTGRFTKIVDALGKRMDNPGPFTE